MSVLILATDNYRGAPEIDTTILHIHPSIHLYLLKNLHIAHLITKLLESSWTKRSFNSNTDIRR